MVYPLRTVGNPISVDGIFQVSLDTTVYSYPVIKQWNPAEVGRLSRTVDGTSIVDPSIGEEEQGTIVLPPKPSKIVWDTSGDRRYESGIDRGVLYPLIGPGVPWNGLISIKEIPVGGESSAYYYDGVKYHTRLSPEEFSVGIEAYTYPDEFMECDGTASLGEGLFVDKQARQEFGLCYRTKIGNDIDGLDHGYKIHLVYNALAAPSNKDYSSLGGSVDAITFNWNVTTTPIVIQGKRASAHFIVDTTKTPPGLLIDLEEILYGTDDADPRMPTADEVMGLFGDWPILQIVDNGDGTWTATGNSKEVSFISDTEFQIVSDTAVQIDDNSYTLSSVTD